ncbi:olfactory receptor 4C11-like [Muntiacus reevesi]|uniref:olfactory receptor 4C11-like n=1 Tax=Muntiacus reevesi TaxID=9886 RepID=UPI0033078EAA
MEVNSSVNKFVLLGLTQNLLKDKSDTWQLNVFFLFYLSFVDACFSTTTAPRLIVDSISEKKVVSFNGCMTQIFAFHFFGCMGILVLALLSFDRHVAICKLLQFTAIMSQCVCGSLVKLAWVGACIHSSAQILLVLRLPFCGPNVIDHYFCDTQPLLKLAYTDTYVISLLIVFNSGAICTVSFTLLLISYVFILCSLSNHSATELQGKLLLIYELSSYTDLMKPRNNVTEFVLLG